MGVGVIPQFQDPPSDTFSGLILCQRGYLQVYEASEKDFVAICVRSSSKVRVLQCYKPVWNLKVEKKEAALVGTSMWTVLQTCVESEGREERGRPRRDFHVDSATNLCEI